MNGGFSLKNKKEPLLMVNEPMPIIPKVNIIKDTTEGSSSLVKTLFKE